MLYAHFACCMHGVLIVVAMLLKVHGHTVGQDVLNMATQCSHRNTSKTHTRALGQTDSPSRRVTRRGRLRTLVLQMQQRLTALTEWDCTNFERCMQQEVSMGKAAYLSVSDGTDGNHFKASFLVMTLTGSKAVQMVVKQCTQLTMARQSRTAVSAGWALTRPYVEV